MPVPLGLFLKNHSLVSTLFVLKQLYQINTICDGALILKAKLFWVVLKAFICDLYLILCAELGHLRREQPAPGTPLNRPGQALLSLIFLK